MAEKECAVAEIYRNGSISNQSEDCASSHSFICTFSGIHFPNLLIEILSNMYYVSEFGNRTGRLMFKITMYYNFNLIIFFIRMLKSSINEEYLPLNDRFQLSIILIHREILEVL